jgi:hypothetical protein
MVHFFRKQKLALFGVFIGAIAGYAYWYYVGCASGHCPISSLWYNSTLYGALVGAILGSSFKKSEYTANGLNYRKLYHLYFCHSELAKNLNY